MAYNDSDYTIMISHVLTQALNFGAETHLVARVRSAFAFPSVTISRVLALTFTGRTALRKAYEDSDYIAMINIVH